MEIVMIVVVVIVFIMMVLFSFQSKYFTPCVDLVHLRMIIESSVGGTEDPNEKEPRLFHLILPRHKREGSRG